MLKGLSASNGVGMANVLILAEKVIDFNRDNILPDNTSDEIQRFLKAVAESEKQLRVLYEKGLEKLGHEAEIIRTQISMLDDPVIIDDVQHTITNDLKCAEHAVEVVLDGHIAVLQSTGDAQFRERALDLIDLKKRLLATLTNNSIDLLFDKEVVVVCNMLTPSQTADFDPKFVRGIICESGGYTSHAAIIARNLEIPAIVGCKHCTAELKDGDLIFIDGSKGEAFVVNRDTDDLEELGKQLEARNKVKAELRKIMALPTETIDGTKVSLYANVGGFEEVEPALDYGCDGIGLFRTEFLYMTSKTLPDEDVQFGVYKRVVQQMNGKKTIFRTFDIGGDKDVPAIKIPREDNPFLGWRAIRICLDEKELLKVQLRALLRASAFGNAQIMIPMIASVSEISAVKEIHNEVKAELRSEGVSFDENTPLGIMIEIPSAAICADTLIKESDFFSIGTNDLIQYTLAVDRGNEKVAKYYDFYNPAVLRLVEMTINASHKVGKITGMCGEAAGDVMATMLLLGLGLDSFSMSAPMIPKVKKIITSIDMHFAKEVASSAMEMDTGEEVRKFLLSRLEEKGLEYLVTL